MKKGTKETSWGADEDWITLLFGKTNSMSCRTIQKQDGKTAG